MDRAVKADFYFKDDRGKLVQLVHEGYEQVNILCSNKGVHRGGHYHTHSTEAFYVVEGTVEVTIHKTDKTEEQTFTFSTDDFFKINPGEVHSMYFPEDCTMVVMYDRWIEKDGEKDIHQVEE